MRHIANNGDRDSLTDGLSLMRLLLWCDDTLDGWIEGQFREQQRKNTVLTSTTLVPG